MGYMNYYKENNETIKEYKLRLFRNKDLYGLNTEQIAQLINNETGDNFSESAYRKWYRPYQEGYEDGIQSVLENDSLLDEYEEKRLEFEKEKVKFRDYRNSYNKIIREQARNESNLDLILDAIAKKEPYPVPHDNNTITYTTNNDLLVCLNDIHYGAVINNHWNQYNSDIAYDRLCEYFHKIIQIKETHHARNCYVCANGDLISGNIHLGVDLTNRENLIEQVIGVSEILSSFLVNLSFCFEHVTFAVVAGNHSRLRKKKTDSLYERLDDLIPWYLKARLQDNQSVTIVDDTIDKTLNIINIQGKNYLNVHGDYDGIKTVEKVISMVDKPIYGVCFGHLHHNVTDWVQGYKVLMSGSLMGMDDLCVSRRILGKAQQLVCVCNKEGVIATYDVELQ